MPRLRIQGIYLRFDPNGLEHKKEGDQQGSTGMGHHSIQKSVESTFCVTFQHVENGQKHQHINKNIAQKPQVAHMWIISQRQFVEFLEEEHMQRSNSYNTKKQRQQNPSGPLPYQLFPVSFSHGKIKPHA